MRAVITLAAVSGMSVGLVPAPAGAEPGEGHVCDIELVASYNGGGLNITTPTAGACVSSSGAQVTVAVQGTVGDVFPGCFAWTRLGGGTLTITVDGEVTSVANIRLIAVNTGGLVQLSLLRHDGAATVIGHGTLVQEPDIVDACLPQAVLVTTWAGPLTIVR